MNNFLSIPYFCPHKFLKPHPCYKMKKVLIITYYWPPSGGAGVQRALKFVKYIPQFNIQPIVLTVDENHGSYPVLDESLLKDIPAGTKIYKTNSFEPLKILSSVASKKAIPYGGFSGQNKEKLSQKILRFIRGNFFIPDARVGWVKYAFAEACRIIEAEKVDTILISSPPHSSQLIGLKLKKKYPHLKWIADLRDPWTDIYYYKEMLHTSLAKEKDGRMERNVLDQSDAVLMVSEDIKRSFIAKSSSQQKDKFHVIPNGYDRNDFKPNTADEFSEFVITYVGTIADVYEPQVFFDVMRNLIDKHPNDNIRIRFVGSISPVISASVAQLDLNKHCEFISHVSHDEAIEYMVKSTMLLLVIPEVFNNKGILTGKLFEYLNTRKPILGLGPEDGDAAAIINECNAGKMFDRTSKPSIEYFAENIFQNWKERTLTKNPSTAVDKYSRQEQAKVLAAIINKNETK